MFISFEGVDDTLLSVSLGRKEGRKGGKPGEVVKCTQSQYLGGGGERARSSTSSAATEPV